MTLAQRLLAQNIYLNSCGNRAPITPERVTLLDVTFEFIFHPDDKEPSGFRRNIPLIRALRIVDGNLGLKQTKEFIVDGRPLSGVFESFEAVTEYMNAIRREFKADGLKSNLTPTSIKEKIVHV